MHNPSFLTSNGHFLSNLVTLDSAKYSNEPPRTINYYSPKFTLGNTTKVQVGVSYTPDSSNNGAGTLTDKKSNAQAEYIVSFNTITEKEAASRENINFFEIDKSIKDAVTAGIKLEHEFKEDVKLKLALTGEYGKTIGKAKKFISTEDNNPIEYKIANLKSYNIGGELKVDNVTYNACYGNLGKSFTTPELYKSGTKSHYYNIGTSYTHNTTTTKLSYFESDQYKNKANVVKLNISHLLVSGLKTYAELSRYQLKGKPEFYKELKDKTIRGNVVLLGMKLKL